MIASGNYERARDLPKVLPGANFGCFMGEAREDRSLAAYRTQLNIQGLKDLIERAKRDATTSTEYKYSITTPFVRARAAEVALAGEERILEAIQSYREAA